MNESPSAPPPSYDDITAADQQRAAGVKHPYANQYHSSQNPNLVQPSTFYQGGQCQPPTQIPPNWVPIAPSSNPVLHVQPPTVINQQRQQVIYVQAGPMQFGRQPCRMVCPSCHQSMMTRVEHENSSNTHLIALALCFLGFWCCFYLPYLMDSCKNTAHYCRKCNQFLGAGRR